MMSQAFKQAYESLVRGDDGMISEISITPAQDLPTLADVSTEVAEDKVKEVHAPSHRGVSTCSAGCATDLFCPPR
jgi:hypothetical protein